MIVHPGRSGIDQARMLAGNGYGVLLMNRRGEGDSEGETNLFGWSDPRTSPERRSTCGSEEGIAPEAIGGLGLSVGGEVMLEHAARSDDLAGVVVEGMGSRSIKESLELSGRHPGRRARHRTADDKQPRRARRPGRRRQPRRPGEGLAPARAFIVWGEDGQPAEKVLGPTYVEAAGDAATWWEVPDAGHTRGIDAAPEEYERRVIAFFDAALLHEHVNRTHPRTHPPLWRVI